MEAEIYFRALSVGLMKQNDELREEVSRLESQVDLLEKQRDAMVEKARDIADYNKLSLHIKMTPKEVAKEILAAGEAAKEWK